MGRLLQLKAWTENSTLAEMVFEIEPPSNLLEKTAVWYFRQHFGKKIKEILTANPVYTIKRHIRRFNEINGTNFNHLHDVEIKNLKLKQFTKDEEETKPIMQPYRGTVYDDFIARTPPEFQKNLLSKNTPNGLSAYYLPLETASQIIATFKGTITLLSPLFGDEEQEYNIRIDVVQYQNTLTFDQKKVEPDDVKIQIHIYDKNTIPCTAYEYGVDLTKHTFELLKKMGILNKPGIDIVDVITQVPSHLRGKNNYLDYIYQEMFRLRETVKDYVEEFLENDVISPTSILTFFDHAKVYIKFAEAPGDSCRQVVRQFHGGHIDARYFYDKKGAEAYEEACRSAEYVYADAEKNLLSKHAGKTIEEVNPELVISIGCGSGEKEYNLFKDRPKSSAPKFIGIDSSPAMLAYFIDTIKNLHPDIDTVFDDLRNMELPNTPERRVLFTFLGNTLGNFSLQEQITILAKIIEKMKGGDKLLLGLNKYNSDTDNPSFKYDESATEFVSGAITSINLHRKIKKTKQFDIEQRVHYILATIQENCEIEINGEKHHFKKGEQARLIQSKRYTKKEVEELIQVSGFENFEIFENNHTFLVIVSKL